MKWTFNGCFCRKIASGESGFALRRKALKVSEILHPFVKK